MSRTPRPPLKWTGISAALNLIVLPVFVTRIIASLGPTRLMPSTSPFFCSHFTLMTPMPPLAWFLYSEQATRFPNPFSVTVKSEQASSITSTETSSSPFRRRMPMTP